MLRETSEDPLKDAAPLPAAKLGQHFLVNMTHLLFVVGDLILGAGGGLDGLMKKAMFQVRGQCCLNLHVSSCPCWCFETSDVIVWFGVKQVSNQSLGTREGESLLGQYK